MASADELRQMLKNNPQLGVINVADLPPGFFGKSAAKNKAEASEIRRHKYNAQRTQVDGITFDSKKEAKEYQNLKLLERVGAITDLQLQPAFLLQAAYMDSSGKRQRAIHYVADFAYTQEGRRIVVDVKGMQTPVFKLKAKLFGEKFPELQLVIK
jgi:hypothetical protein